jgi:hypothetical protein
VADVDQGRSAITVWYVQVTPDDIVPVLAIDHGRRGPDVAHPFAAGLAVTYVAAATPEQPLGWADLRGLRLDERTLHRYALDNLDAMLGTVSLHGGLPAFMVSFHGIESSLLLADAFWNNLPVELPGDPVVAVPARDVLLITGSESESGLAKAGRCVDRVFFAGAHHLLIQNLLVRHGNRWRVFDPGGADEVPAPVEEWYVPQQRAALEERWSTPEDRTIFRRRAG